MTTNHKQGVDIFSGKLVREGGGGMLQNYSILKTLQSHAGSTIALCTSGLSGGVRSSKADTQFMILSRAACFLCVTA